jgi:hypothetical protein
MSTVETNKDTKYGLKSFQRYESVLEGKDNVPIFLRENESELRIIVTK